MSGEAKVPAAVAAVPQGDSPLGAPSEEVAPPDDDLFSVPVIEEEPEPAPLPQATAPVSEASAALPSSGPASEASSAPSAPMSDSSLQERLVAELRELRDIVNGSDSLAFLRSRVARAIDEKQSDALTLVSFYRLVARSLAENADAARRDADTARSRANKMELELAAAAVGAPVVSAKAAAAPAANPERVTQLEEELKASNEQREKLLVDFKNMRERTQKDLNIQEFRFKDKFFRDLLPVLDSFERAQQTMNEQSSAQSLIEGNRMIFGQMEDFLRQQGLELVETSGEFDPRVHEAVGEVHNETTYDDHVFDVLSRGYRLGERLIRAAMVRISRNPGNPAPPPEI